MEKHYSKSDSTDHSLREPLLSTAKSEQSQKAHPSFIQTIFTRHYMMLSLFSAFCFGSINFIFDFVLVKSESQGLRLLYLTAPGSWIYAIAYHVY